MVDAPVEVDVGNRQSRLRHAPPSRASGSRVVVLDRITKVYEPTARWMRPFARTHIRSPITALDGVDLAVREGEICAIVGPNGAGKTTLFRIIVGLTTPSSGRGRVMDFDVEHDSEAVRQAVGWMPAEDRSLLMRATSKENLQLHGRLQGMTVKELRRRIPEILDVVDLTTHTDSIAASLSSGMRARLRLARALLARPKILLLDEPTGAIDPIAAHSLLRLIMQLAKEERLGVLLSSHRLEEIEALQSNALLLDRGRVRYVGDLDRLRSTLEEPRLEITFNTEVSATRMLRHLTTRGLDVTRDGLALVCQLRGRAAVGELLSGMPVADQQEVRRIRELPMPLRDIIAHVYSTEDGSEASQ
jgi:ABC-2 type transport system ATP-binding protein